MTIHQPDPRVLDNPLGDLRFNFWFFVSALAPSSWKA